MSGFLGDVLGNALEGKVEIEAKEFVLGLLVGQVEVDGCALGNALMARNTS